MGSLSRPRRTRLRGADDPSANVPAEGPVPRGRCIFCRQYFADDIYLERGLILCGDCRYYVRHGRWPNYERRPRDQTADEMLAEMQAKGYLSTRVDS